MDRSRIDQGRSLAYLTQKKARRRSRSAAVARNAFNRSAEFVELVRLADYRKLSRRAAEGGLYPVTRRIGM